MKRTPEEAAQWRQKMGELAKRIRAMSDEQKQKIQAQCGVVTCEGRPLSLYNTCYLWAQTGGRATMVGGFRQWNKVGRTVTKGQHAAGYIYVPTGRNKADTGEAEDGDGVRFVLVPVFDVTQTEEVAAAVA